jgi:hypothetical protein
MDENGNRYGSKFDYHGSDIEDFKKAISNPDEYIRIIAVEALPAGRHELSMAEMISRMSKAAPNGVYEFNNYSGYSRTFTSV